MRSTNLKKVQNEFQVEYVIHLPDKWFVDWCSEKFLVNRGVFNIIDHWFFDYGLENIVLRRKAMVQFFKFIQSEHLYNHQNMYLQFGKGGVKKSLYCFVDKCLNKQKSRK